MAIDRRRLLEQFSAAWNARDVGAAMELMTDDCEFGASVGRGPGTRYRGRSEVERAFRAFLSGEPDPGTAIGPVSYLVSEHFAVTRWTTTTRRHGEPDVVVGACDIFTFRGDAIASKDTYRKVLGEPPC